MTSRENQSEEPSRGAGDHHLEERGGSRSPRGEAHNLNETLRNIQNVLRDQVQRVDHIQQSNLECHPPPSFPRVHAESSTSISRQREDNQANPQTNQVPNASSTKRI